MNTVNTVSARKLDQTIDQRITRPRHRQGTSGQALVEFAIVVPVLLLIALGIVDFGRVFHTYVALANAAREGARFCALYPGASNAAAAGVTLKKRVAGDSPGTTVTATSELGGRIPQADLTVTAWLAATATLPKTTPAQTCPDATEGREVTVQVVTPFKPITPFIGGIVGNPIQVRGWATMVVWPATG